MTKPIALLCVVSGMAWHMLVVMFMGRGFLDACNWGLVAGAVAGYCAGAFTIASRQEREGRESLLDVVVTYYLGVGVYYLCAIPIAFCSGVTNLSSITDMAGTICFALFYVVLIATVLGIVLLPVCWLTRHIVWLVHTKMHPK